MFVGILQFWPAVWIDLGSVGVVIINGTRPMFSTVYNDSNLDTVHKLKHAESASSSLEISSI